METKVICRNHGIIQTIPHGVMWMGELPKPWTHCPYCGEPTKVEYPPPMHYTFMSYTCPNEEQQRKSKEIEVEYYRGKYWPEKN
jgi:hypothetical protein